MSTHYDTLNTVADRMAPLAKWTLDKARAGQLIFMLCEEKERKTAAEWCVTQLRERFSGLDNLNIEVVHPYNEEDQVQVLKKSGSKVSKNTWRIVVLRNEEDRFAAELYSPEEHLLTVTLAPKAWTEHLLIEASGPVKLSSTKRV